MAHLAKGHILCLNTPGYKLVKSLGRAKGSLFREVLPELRGTLVEGELCVAIKGDSRHREDSLPENSHGDLVVRSGNDRPVIAHDQIAASLCAGA